MLRNSRFTNYKPPLHVCKSQNRILQDLPSILQPFHTNKPFCNLLSAATSLSEVDGAQQRPGASTERVVWFRRFGGDVAAFQLELLQDCAEA